MGSGWAGPRRRRAGGAGSARALTALGFLVALGYAPAARAQVADTAGAVSRGGRYPSGYGLAATVGLPPRVRPFVGPYLGALGPGGAFAALGGGVYRDILNPALGLLGAQIEGYVGTDAETRRPRESLAVGIRSPSLRLGFGLDFEFPSGDAAPYLSLMHPLRRGGLVIPGTLLHATWVLGGQHRLRLGFAVPVGQPLVGEDRPGSDRVHLPAGGALPTRGPGAAADPLDGALAELRTRALRVNEVVVPYLGRAGSPRDAESAQIADSLAALARVLASGGGRGALGVVGGYHASLDRACSLALDPAAAGVTPDGRALADSVRSVLLSTVLLPFDRLLGQKRVPETLAPFAAAAEQALRAPALVVQAGRPAEASPHAASAPPASDRPARVLAALLGAMDEIVTLQRRRWGDVRLVWLPLQLGLRDEQHERQAQIDSLVERATGGVFSDSNDVAYVHTEQFQWELYRSIHEARSYHVLWVHDFRGLNDAGLPDGVAFRQVAYGYLGALIEHVQAYDSTGVVPEYQIFLDQYYFETDRGRLWLDMLRDPLGRRVRLRGAPRAWQVTLDSLQDALARAVAGSRRLRADARAHGGAWLRDRVSVHVHITNQADPSFWSRDILPLVGLTDNVIRDHRKLAFYDLTEGDPYRGMLLVTGMGVGENFASPEWDDRAVLLKGPAALAVKREAAALLMDQGVKPKQLPFWLRPAQDTVPIKARAPAPRFDMVPARVAQLHNEIGYGDKRVTVAKAMLYTLLPPGSVAKIPDSLWNNPLWAALLLGDALRGGRVLVMAPSVKNAPAPGAGEMALAEDVLARLLVARRALAPALDAAGGLLRVGIYDVAIPVTDIPAQIDTALANRARLPWLQRLEPFSPAVVDSLRAVSAELKASGFPPPAAKPRGMRDPEHPKLHMKAQFFASAQGWDNLFRDPAWGTVLADYFRGRARLVREAPQYTEFYRLQPLPESRAASGGLFSEQARAQKPDTSVYYLLMGSHNEDYRSALLDGEDVLLLAHYGAAVGIADFVLMPSLCTWVDSVDELHRYLPRKRPLVRRLASWARILF